MKIWKIELTAKGKEISPKFGINRGHVIVAKHQHRVRKMASKFPGAEGTQVWLDTRCSTVWCIGITPPMTFEHKVLTDSKSR